MGLRFNYFSSLAFAVALCLFVVFLFVFFLVEDPSLVVVLLALSIYRSTYYPTHVSEVSNDRVYGSQIP